MTGLYLIVLPAALVVGALAGPVLSLHRARRHNGYRQPHPNQLTT